MRREAIPLAIIFILVLAATVTGIFYHPGGRQIQAVTVGGRHRFPRRLYIWFSILLGCALAIVFYANVRETQESPS